MSERKLSSKQRFWLEHVEACTTSGGSMKGYAEKNGLDLQKFYLWKGRLKKLGVIEGLQSPQSVSPVRVSSTRSAASIRLSNGIGIDVPGDFDPAAMAEFLKAAMRI